MVFYLASQYARRDELRVYAQLLTDAGHTVTSRWLLDTNSLTVCVKDLAEDDLSFMAVRDIEDIDKAEALVAFSEAPEVATKRGARHVEFGYAIAKKMSIFVVGPRENVFHFLPVVKRHDDINSLINSL